MSKLPSLPPIKASAPAPDPPVQTSDPVPAPTPDPVVSQYLAQKTFAMQGKSYLGGDPIDVSNLADHKISQLLNQRWIRPNPDYKPT